MQAVRYHTDDRIARITLNRPGGMNFKARSEQVGWRQAVKERDSGTYDWSQDRPINAPK